jgi:diguanylate cyclase (GGDEF)-like protein
MQALDAHGVDRLLEATWEQRRARASRREGAVEAGAGLLFAAVAAALALGTGAAEALDAGTAALLLALYIAVARVEFPIGAGHVVPTQLVLVPMLVLLPPGAIPGLVAIGLVAGATVDWCIGRISPRRVLSALPDSWHAVGPAVVLIAAGAPQINDNHLPLLALAFAACCLTDMAAVLGRAALTRPRRELLVFARVVMIVWVVDACLVPIALAVGVAARYEHAATLLVLPLALLFLLLARDRNRRIDQAHRRLKLVEHERERLQAAVRRLGDAFAAKHDLGGLMEILLRGSVEAVDAEAGEVDLSGHAMLRVDATDAAPAGRCEFRITVPLVIAAGTQRLSGELRLVRGQRPFEDDEAELLRELVRKAEIAGAEILEHRALRDQALTDALTKLGNRRQLQEDLAECLERRGGCHGALLLFDLDGFKRYNDVFGHMAGDSLLTRVADKLAFAAEPNGRAYRLGGDEFCALFTSDVDDVGAIVERCRDALSETGDDFSIRASCGAVVLPLEARSPMAALQLADTRMYADKRGHSARPREVAELARRFARRLGLADEALDEVVDAFLLAADERSVGGRRWTRRPTQSSVRIGS